MQTITLKSEENGKRIDAYVSSNTDITRSRAASLLEEGNITVNGVVPLKSYKLKIGDEICVNIPDPIELDVVAQDIPLDIVYEDEHLLVVNKPKGMVVHPAAGNYEGTLVNAILFHCKGSLSGINGVMRPGIVHRIDKDTSGLLIVAKNDTAHLFLAEQIKEHSFTREYEAVVHGNIKADNGSIDAPIGRHPVKRKQMAVTPENSKNAVTHFTVLQRFGEFTHVRLRLETGRTHQIRVHMSYIGHAVAGDEVYGPKNVVKGLGGQCLHAKKIGFIHPQTHEYMEFDSELPQYFNSFLAKMN
ncbi:MAG: RluA family pseudouridine synthase [Clostridia bacterium]|nr:RluA family pseudouridine synthase [Clostridia bacterium]